MAVSVHSQARSAEPALAAYEAMAPFYDGFTADYAHGALLAGLEAVAKEHGLQGRELLDVGCGTGKSFGPMLARGYDVTACDLSPAMVEVAAGRAAGRAKVFVADMRDLPPGGPFDLITCLDDAVNYLVGDEDLDAAMRSFARVLGPAGVLLFDLNTLRTYRTTFAEDFVEEADGAVYYWHGEGDPHAGPGAVCAATIEFLSGAGASPVASHHVQRHHPRSRVEEACAAAGLRVAAVRGLLPGGAVDDHADEERHHKLLYVVRPRADGLNTTPGG